MNLWLVKAYQTIRKIAYFSYWVIFYSRHLFPRRYKLSHFRRPHPSSVQDENLRDRILCIRHSLKLSPIRRMPLRLLHLPPLLWRSQALQLLLSFLLIWKLYWPHKWIKSPFQSSKFNSLNHLSRYHQRKQMKTIWTPREIIPKTGMGKRIWSRSSPAPSHVFSQRERLTSIFRWGSHACISTQHP